MILSGDPPRGRLLVALLAVIVLVLALAPFLFPGAKSLNVAATVGHRGASPRNVWTTFRSQPGTVAL